MKKTVISLIILNMLFGSNLDQQLKIAGGNAHQIKKAITGVPKEQLAGMEWLIKNMQKEDLRSLSAQFLLTNCELAYDVWQNNKWGKKIPEDIKDQVILIYDNEPRNKEIIKIKIHPNVAIYILNNKIQQLKDIEMRQKVSISFENDNNMIPPNFVIETIKENYVPRVERGENTAAPSIATQGQNIADAVVTYAAVLANIDCGCNKISSALTYTKANECRRPALIDSSILDTVI